jgi:hypothetical protein
MTGEDIQKGDYVTFDGKRGRVEFVADPSMDDPETAWCVREFGGGVMIQEPKSFGSAFVSQPHTTEDLILVARQSETENRELRTEN